MKRKQVCNNCGNEYTTSMIKVWVSKRRYCSKCKKPMFADNEKKTMKCGKCGLKVKFSDDRKVGEMRVSIKGVTRDSRLAQINRRKGLEVTKTFQPKHRVCQNCRNFRRRIENMVAKKERMSKGEVKKMSDTEILDVFHKKVKQKLKKEQQEKAKAEAEETKYEEVQKSLKKEKKQIEKAEVVKNALIEEMLEKKKEDEKSAKAEKENESKN